MANQPEKVMDDRERLIHLINVLNLSIPDFAKDVLKEDRAQNIYNYVQNGIKPRASFWKKVAQALPDADPVWLSTGYGEPYRPGQKSQSPYEQIDQLRALVKRLEIENEQLRQEKDAIYHLVRQQMGKHEGVTDCLVDLPGASDLLSVVIDKNGLKGNNYGHP
ncbi:hypothetical protein [Tellurirhabdus bombi]|uniref:hypothetical protein n=1 Tax=Tellurirhabdus bombi TaxID=2907205 RepID=UPI001F17BBA5|nr:hypothetical protein [Tellurirhabdus bombi]